MPTTPSPNDGHVPLDKITEFDRAEYDNLIAWIDGVDRDLRMNLGKPRPGVRLDATLGSGISPGSPNWPPAARFTSQAKEFGKSVAERYAELSKDWELYIAALRGGRDVFESTDDLSTYSANKFVEEYPDTLPSSTGNGPPTTGGPNPPKTT
jgi:hypothetical protein